MGNDCSIISADVSNKSSIDKIYSKINNKQKIDVLINNAGVGVFNKIENTSIDEWDRQINTNLKGSFLMTKMVVNDMIKKKSFWGNRNCETIRDQACKLY